MGFGLVAAGCGGDNGATGDDAEIEVDAGSLDDRDAYVEALAFLWDRDENTQFTSEENRCAAEAYVEVIGVETLSEHASPEEIRAAPEKNLVDFGVEIDEQLAREIHEASSGCGDLRAAFLDGLTETLRGMTGGEIDEVCLDQSLDDSRLETFEVEQLQRGRSGPASRRTPEIAEMYVDWIDACVDLRGALTRSLQASIPEVRVSPSAASCIEREIDDDLARRSWIDLFIGETTSAAKDELTAVVEGCAS